MRIRAALQRVRVEQSGRRGHRGGSRSDVGDPPPARAGQVAIREEQDQECPGEADRRRPLGDRERSGDVGGRKRSGVEPDPVVGVAGRTGEERPARPDREQDPADGVRRLLRPDDDPGDGKQHQHDRDPHGHQKVGAGAPEAFRAAEVAREPRAHDRHDPKNGRCGEDGPRQPSPHRRSLGWRSGSSSTFSIFHRVVLARPRGQATTLRRLRMPEARLTPASAAPMPAAAPIAASAPLEPGAARRGRGAVRNLRLDHAGVDEADTGRVGRPGGLDHAGIIRPTPVVSP